MVPSSVEKSNVAGALRPLTVMTESDVVLLITPLGVDVAPLGLPGGVGILISAPLLLPWASNRMPRPEPLAATRNWPDAVSKNPQGFISLGSVCAASPGMFETRGVSMKPVVPLCDAACWEIEPPAIIGAAEDKSARTSRTSAEIENVLDRGWRRF